MMRALTVVLALGLATSVAWSAETRRAAAPPATEGVRAGEIVHPAAGHEVRLSPPAVAADREGPIVAWMAPEGHDNIVHVARPGGERVRVTPPGLSGDSLHQAPGLAVGAGGEIYVTWSSRRPKPVDGLFASVLQLSRSLDGGKTFEAPLRVSDDAPTSHSFEDIAVLADGTVILAWIETPQGQRPRTFLARVIERGGRIERVAKIDDDETCVCCRVAIGTARPQTVAVLWRKVFAGDIRDMVLARSTDGARTIGAATKLHADNWRITACPHRGGRVAIDARGRLHAVWYTEGTRNEPDVLYAIADESGRFGTPRRVHVSSSSIPDQPRLVVRSDGRAIIVWEDATAVRRRVLMREATATTITPVRTLSNAIKAYAPDVTLGADGDALVAWHEEQFPRLKTIVMRLAGPAAASSRQGKAR